MTSRAMRRANERRTAKEARRSQVKARTLAAGATVALGATVVYVPPAEAATLTVTTTADSGPGSLRAAVEQASADFDHDTITFAPTVTGTITLTSGQIAATGSITIEGPGSDELTIDAGGESRVFSFSTAYYGGDEVVVSGLTLTGGAGRETSGSLYSGHGGAVYLAWVDAELSDVVVTDSHGRHGGGIAGRTANVVLSDVTIDGNEADAGGGLWLRRGSLSVESSVVSGNHADRDGGGILHYRLYGDATITGSLIVDNDADGNGGGLASTAYYDLSFSASVVNTTIAGNHADQLGGGVFIGDIADGDVHRFTSTTIAGNTSPRVGGVAAGAGSKVLENSIVADNTKRDLRLTSSSDPFALDFSLVENAGTTPITQVSPGSSPVGVDPALGALTDNGGPFETVAPTADSPVVDAGKSFGLAIDQRGEARPLDRPDAANAADGTDMGAVELKLGESPALNPDPAPDPEEDPLPLVTNLNDNGPGSLRAAVLVADETPGHDTVTFEASVTGTIELTSGAIVSAGDEPLTIDGPGAEVLTIDANGASRVLQIGEFYGYSSPDEEAVVVSGLTLTGGHAQRYHAPYTYYGSYYPGGWTLEPGGAVLVSDGELTLDQVVITDSRGSRGGAVFVTGRAHVTLTDSEISGNEATSDGGGLSLGRAGQVLITGTEITDNQAEGYGGGVDVGNARTFVLDASTVSGNTADRGGGGVRVRALSAYQPEDSNRIVDSLISGNSTAGIGGGIGIFGDESFYSGPDRDPTAFSFTVESSTISGNHADQAGGGAYVGPQVSSSMYYGTAAISAPTIFTGATVAGNTAAQGGGIAAASGEKVLRSSIVADNTNGDVRLLSSSDPFVLDYSLVESAGTTPITQETAGTNVLGQDPQLGALADNGGPTLTQAPGASSPAVDRGKAFGVQGDQRGSTRPVDDGGVANAAGGDGSDIGAVELQTGTPVESVPPSAPRVRGAGRGDGSISIDWDAPRSDGGAAVTGYQVQQRSGGAWSTVRSIGAETTSATVTGLVNDTTYTLRVVATNTRGASAPSAAVTATPVSATASRPAPPVLTAATAGNGSVTLSWTPGAANGSAITRYRVAYHPVHDDRFVPRVDVAAPATGATITGLTNQTTYQFQVTAYNGRGASDYVQITATPTAPVVAPPGTGAVAVCF